MTGFQFIYHLKGQSWPSIMVLFSQFLDRTKQSYKGVKVSQKGDEKGIS